MFCSPHDNIELRLLCFDTFANLNVFLELDCRTSCTPSLWMAWEEKLLLWKSRNIIIYTLLGMDMKSFTLQLFLFKLVIVGWLLCSGKDITSNKREIQQEVRWMHTFYTHCIILHRMYKQIFKSMKMRCNIMSTFCTRQFTTSRWHVFIWCRSRCQCNLLHV